MKIHLLLPLTLSLLVAACSPGSGPDVPDHVVQAFDRLHMKMYADTDRATTARPITITTEVTPLVSGKGRITMYSGNGSWRFLSPVERTIEIDMSKPFDSSQVTDYLVEFTANKRLVVPWTLELLHLEGHDFYASVFLDSVFVADSNRYFSVWSHEARVRTPGGFGYNDAAAFPDLRIAH
ncbi:MAG TPA: hypothetical protein VHI13_12650 [Candidatus Kapabacteria bacterium]|nr:hypothetical protein [Candidatus Kapabacteria bacterium]